MSTVLAPSTRSTLIKPPGQSISGSDACIRQCTSIGLDYHRFSVDDLDRMVEQGVLASETPVELIDGLLLNKPSRNPMHDGTLDLLEGLLLPFVPVGWFVRTQRTVRLSTESSLEPDLAIVRGDLSTYLNHHPNAAETGLIVEVANSSLKYDRETKSAVYADAGIPHYWVVNLIDRTVEVFSDPYPASDASTARYRQHASIPSNGSLALILDGRTVATINVGSFLV